MQSAYIPVLIYAALVMAFPAVTLVLAKFIRPASTSFGAKLKPYECGIPPESDARGRYSVRFFIVAMLFVIFDVETMFLIPWAIRSEERRVGKECRCWVSGSKGRQE